VFRRRTATSKQKRIIYPVSKGAISLEYLTLRVEYSGEIALLENVEIDHF